MKKSLLAILLVLLPLNSDCCAAYQNICTVTGCADIDFARDSGALQFSCTATKGLFLFSTRNVKIVQGSNTLRLHPFFAGGNLNAPLVECDNDSLCLKILKKDAAISGTIRCLPKWFAVDQQFTISYKGTDFLFEALPSPPADKPFTVIAHVTAKDIDSVSCSIPVSVDSFSTADAVFHSWLSFKNAKINDVLEWKFYGPNSARYHCHYRVLEYEEGCLYWGVRIQGSRVQYMPGRWSVDVYHNGIFQFTDTFTLTKE